MARTKSAGRKVHQTINDGNHFVAEQEPSASRITVAGSMFRQQGWEDISGKPFEMNLGGNNARDLCSI
jgi:hypothetical protein